MDKQEEEQRVFDMAKSANLHKAKGAKNDEFYTQLTDVSKELMHYKQHFKDKVVFCNCDDPTMKDLSRPKNYQIFVRPMGTPKLSN